MLKLITTSALSTGLLLILSLSSLHAAPQVDRTKVGDAVQRVLPNGWTVTRIVHGSIPPDWISNSPTAGTLVEGGKGSARFQIWFLPPDWIGIRRRSERTPRTLYWQGILSSGDYKTITFSTDETIHKRAGDIFLANSWTTPALCNGGHASALQAFRGKLDQADAVAMELVRKHCKSPEEFTEAAESLVVLGVPAKSVFIKGAREIEGMEKDLVCSALGHIGDREAIAALCEVVANPKVEDERRKYAAMALVGHDDPRIGPALRTGLKTLTANEPLAAFAQGLVRAGHRAAVPEMLAAFKRTQSDYCKCEVANSLAAFRCKEAVPLLRAFLDDYRRRKQSVPESAAIALLRLTGDWGKESESCRVLVVPPVGATLGMKMEVVIWIEQMQKGRTSSRNISANDLHVDGKKPDLERFRFGSFGGISGVSYPGDVSKMACDISSRITTPGKHTIRCEWGEASSRELTFEVLPRQR